MRADERVSEPVATAAVLRMTALKYFPSEPHARAEIAFMLVEMVSTVEQLDWLVRAILNNSSDWKGFAQLRALLCTRFKPKDGIEGKEYCQISGFTPTDCEAEHQQVYLPSPERKLLTDGASETEPTTDPEFQMAMKQLDAKLKLQAAHDFVNDVRAARVRDEYQAPSWLKNL